MSDPTREALLELSDAASEDWQMAGTSTIGGLEYGGTVRERGTGAQIAFFPVTEDAEFAVAAVGYLRAALSTTPAPDLVDIVDRCRQHIAGLGADLSTIKAREATLAQRDAAANRAYEHLRGIDTILTAALEGGTP